MESLNAYLKSADFWASILIAAFAFAACIVLKRYASKYLEKSSVTGKKENNARFMFEAVKYVIIIFAAVTILQVNGVNVSSMITGLGVAGIVVGFALQDILKDVIMGMNIIRDKFFEAGDVVRYKNIEGKVIFFDIHATKIRDINTGNIFTVCNRNISEIERVSDWVGITIPTSYEEDEKRVREVIKGLCCEIKNIKKVKSCDFLGTDEFAESSVNYRILVHCNPEYKLRVRRESLGVIQDTLRRENIAIPYTKLDVSLIK